MGIQLKREIELCLEVCKNSDVLLISEHMGVLESSQKEPENEKQQQKKLEHRIRILRNRTPRKNNIQRICKEGKAKEGVSQG